MKKILSIFMVFVLSFMLIGCDKSNSDLDAIEKAYESLFENVDRQNVTNDLSFPSKIGEVSIYYSSSNESIISNSGKVVRQAEDEVVVITVSLEMNEASVVKHISFVVKKVDATDAKSVIENAYQKLFNGIDKSNVESDLTFPETVDGVTIIYTTSDESVISKTGKVTRPAQDTDVTVTIKLSYQGESVDKVVTFTVKKQSSTTVDYEALQEALDNFTNFKVSVKVTEDGSDGKSEREVDYFYGDNAIFWKDSEGYEYYVVLDGNNVYGIYNEDDGTYYKVSYDSEEFYYYIMYYGGYDDFVFVNLDATDFDYEDGYYFVKANKLQEVGKEIIGDFDYDDEDGKATDVITYVKVKVENGFVVEMLIGTDYTEETSDSTYNGVFDYEFHFSNYNNTTVELPDVSDTPSQDEINEIPDVYETENNLSVYTGGNVTGILGQYVYISNGTQSLTLYFDKKSEVDYSNLKIGDYIEVLGIKTEYKGLVEVTTITMLEVDESKFQIIEPKDVSSVADLNDVIHQGTIINLQNVKVASAYVASGSKGDYKFSVNDGNSVITVFVKAANESTYHDALSKLAVNDLINLNGFVISWFNGFQLMAINGSAVENAYGLKASTDVITVEHDTELDVALNGVTLSYVSKDGTQEIALSDCTIDSSSYNKSAAGTYVIKISYNDMTTSIKIIVKRAATDSFKSDDATDITRLSKEYNVTVGLPSTGNVNVLVFPIAFTDQTVPANYKDTINKAFNGTSEETGWESLSSYYQKASYDKLHINATVMDAYNTNTKFDKNASYDDAIDLQYVDEVLSYYDSKIDYSEYDANNDGYIDCIYLVYLAPYSDQDSSVWWAFTSRVEESQEYDGKGTDYYMFLSYEFFNDPFNMDDEDESKDVYVNINTQTIIHETGHALGLDDYYDYDQTKGPAGGIGGGDMMDYNVGDHNAYSKTLLGWITPTIVINKDYTATLNSFGASGDAIIVAKDWQNSYFGEYYIIDFYTCDGLNEASKGYSGLFAVNGVRIYHIDSTLKKSINSLWEATEYDNSYTAHKLIKLIEADGRYDIESTIYSKAGGYSEDSDLFQANNSVELKWYDGTFATTIKVNNITSTEANISITFK